MALHNKILLGLVLGAIAGVACQIWLGADSAALKDFVKGYAQPVGRIFLNMIFMIVVPLLFSALVLGVADIGDARKVGRIGVRALALTVLLSGIAVGIGMGGVNLVKPGEGLAPEERARLTALYTDNTDAQKKVEDSQKAKPAGEAIAELIPRNPLQSAVEALEGGLLPFMVFALFFGLAMTMIDAEKALPLKAFFEGLFAISQKIIEMAMKFAPIGVFALVFATAATLGGSAFQALGTYALLVLVALALQLFVVYSAALKFIAKWNPLEFFRRIQRVMLTAFATASSNATLPVALESADKDLGLSRDTSSFVLTLGATANQNGTALFEGITILFLAQFFGIPLDFGQQLTVMGLAILAGIGTAGVPGGSWPMIAIICAKVGIPPEGIGICLGIDRILDMSRTVLNVTGDLTIAACVDSGETPEWAEA